MNINIPEDMMDIVEQLVAYEDTLKKEQGKEDFEFEYAYIEDSLEDSLEDAEEDYKIEISMV